MTTEEYFCSPLDGTIVDRRATPSINFGGTYLYTWVERGTVEESVLPKDTTNVSGQGSNPDRSIQSLTR